MLIEDDRRNGALSLPDVVVGRVLADGEGIMPLELSGLYHRESSVVADKAQEICMDARENLIVEGTLSWDGLAPRLVGDLVARGYERLDVVLVDAPLQTALEQSLLRWWPERQRGGLGGRFTPAAAIRSLYSSETSSVCAANARDLVRRAHSANLATTLKL